MMGTIYAWLAFAAAAYMLFITVTNILYMRVVTRRPSITNGPSVSILIPARNEAQRIRPTLEALSKIEYDSFEVILLDDNSDDGTGDIIAEFVDSRPRFRALKGRPLKEGWKGKPYAMTQLTAAAKGEILLFVDADMRPEPDFVSWIVSNLEHHQVDFLSGYPRHTASEARDYLLFPVAYLSTSFLLPLWLFRIVPSHAFSHVIGQFFCVRADVLRDAGGFEAVKGTIAEDSQMGRHLKGLGYHQVFLDGKRHIHGNLFDSMEHAKMGIMRIVFDFFDYKVYPFVFLGLSILAFLLLPIPLAGVALLSGFSWTGPLTVSVLITLTAWAATMAERRIPWYAAFLYPIHFGWVIILCLRSVVISKRGGGFDWKGRIVR